MEEENTKSETAETKPVNEQPKAETAETNTAEAHQTSSNANPSNPHHNAHPGNPGNPKPKMKRPGKKIIITIVAVVAIIALVLIFWKIPGNVTETEMLNLTYTIKIDNETIDSDTSTFTAGTVASSLGFETGKLDSEIASMQKGEEKDIELEAADAFGAYNEELVFSYNRTEKMNRSNEVDRIINMSLDEFKEIFDEEPIVDTEYTTELAPWPVKVLEKNDEQVKLSQEAEKGDEIPQQIFSYEVTKVTEEKITLTMQGNDTILPTPSGNLEITFTDDYIISTLTPEIGQWIELPFYPEAKVTGMDDTSLFLDANPEYAGKSVAVAIKLNARIIETRTATGSATKITDAPTMQVFIMSYCPYGLQMLKGMLPVMEKFQGVANVELRFVGYVMHGDKEEQENYRMICLREEQYSKLIPYLKCFAEEGDAESCIAQTGVDAGKLDSCIANRAEGYYAEDQALCDEYGVQGSPTTVIDGKVAQNLARSPDAIKTALCEAFTTQPAECSETLSTENPSPGFGSGTGSSGGSCG